MDNKLITYTMPAEWAPHEATLLAWPHNRGDWPGKFDPIPWVYAEIIRYLTQVERVRLLVKNEKQRDAALSLCARAGVIMDKLDAHIISTNRIWMRDSGPILVRDEQGAQTMLDWRFNAWAKYADHKRDEAIPARLAPLLTSPRTRGEEDGGMPRIQPTHNGKRVVLEGGAIDVNGCGTLLATEECLLSDVQVRNPGFTREDYEAVFSQYLGIQHIIWLDKGIIGDDTHGHIDDITRFVNATTVVTVVEKDRHDDNYALLQENLKRLRAARDQNGKPLTVVELPMPRPLLFEGQRLPASYANFYIANQLVLVPTFNDPADRVALAILAELFPAHEVVGIHAVDLVWGLGTLHCLSQQLPA